MNLPIENGEGFQVLHYPKGALSTPHFDFLVPSNPANQASIARSGQRKSSLVIYLNDVEDGGETAFPALGWSILPQRGNAVYFEYANSRGQVDHHSLHAGNAVTSGEKWVATKWMRERRFVPKGDRGIRRNGRLLGRARQPLSEEMRRLCSTRRVRHPDGTRPALCRS